MSNFVKDSAFRPAKRLSSRAAARRKHAKAMSNMTAVQRQAYDRSVRAEMDRFLETNSVVRIPAGRALGTVDCVSMGIDA